MAGAISRRATYADLEAVPETVVAEIIDGVLETHRFLPEQGAVLVALACEIGRSFERRPGSAGGWAVVPRPELRLHQDVVPDLAAWRRDRFDAGSSGAAVAAAPDCICEILSPATRRVDRGAKRRVYARAGVQHLWLLDPFEGVLEAFEISGQRWLLLASVVRGEAVSVAPFNAVSFPLDDLFPFDEPTPSPASEA